MVRVNEPSGSVRELATGVTAVPADGAQPDEELLTINFGPHHPATHGVLRLLVTLRAEEVLEALPYVGYVHTGIEKSCEDKSYWKVIPLVERMDYLSYYFNALAFCMSVERLLDEPVPERAQYLRVIHCELNRIHSHLVWLGTTALDLGAISIFWYCFRERDKILDLFEFSSGQRMHTRYIQVGGVADDIPAGWAEKALRFTEDMEERVGQYEAILDRNEIFLQRTRDVGIVSQERLLELGVTGPLLRASGNPWDLRKAAPYSSYEKFDFKVPVGTVGDCYDRYRVRVAEIRESCSIIRQAIEGLPAGPYITTNRKVALPPRHELATSMEALIHHFKLVTEGFRVPPGEAYAPIESPRGEMGCFVLADGSAKPARVHMRDPSFVNLQALREMVVGGYIADMITNLAMLDPILGGIDR
ncbi:MAG TPA: NADH dehydrogenase (quinone) subunit D [Solirubrobacterales bacterium]|nr:NADH dehydrogenase (quinone) subunit D [Solirubrobacterales bacterium]